MNGHNNQFVLKTQAGAVLGDRAANAAPRREKALDKRIFLIFLLYICAIFLFPRYAELSVGDLRFSVHRILSVVLFFMMLVNATGRLRLRIFTSFGTFMATLYFVVILASLLHQGSEFRSYFLWLDDALISLALISFGVSTLPEERQKIIKFMSAMAVVSALIAIIEFLLQYNVYSILADRSTTIGYYASLDYYRDGLYRAKGAFEQPLVLSVVLVMMLPVVVATSRRIFSISVLIVVSAIVATQSRMGLLLIPFCFLLIVLVPGMIKTFGRSLGLFGVAVILLFLVFFVQSSLESVVMGDTRSEMASSQTRLNQIEIGLALLRDNFLFGFGYGNASTALLEQQTVSLTVYNRTVDNLYLSTALDAGVPGLLCLLSVITAGLMSSASAIARAPNLPALRYASALFVSIACGAIYFSSLSIRTALPIVFLLVGMSIAASRQRNNEGSVNG